MTLAVVVEVRVRQGFRLIAKPATFFNQLQWSTHHWIIMVAFLGLAVVEGQVGRQAAMYQVYAQLLQNHLGIGIDQSVWIVTAIKLTAMVAGALGLTSLIWFVGNLFGRRTSKRVLFRRLAVVFTVGLAGYTLSHLASETPSIVYLSLLFYAWGLILGYHAIREQFQLNHLEAVVVGLFALLLVSSSWHFSNHLLDAVARQQIAVRPNAPFSVKTPGPRF